MLQARYVSLALVLLLSPPSDANDKVIMINVDDLNDWIEPLGGHPDTLTPNLNRLAQRGLNFTNAHATVTACNGSRASFLTGMLPTTSLVQWNYQPDFRGASPVLAGATTLPQAFKNAGFTTKGAGKLFHHPVSDHAANGGGTEWDVWWDGDQQTPHGALPGNHYTGELPQPLNGFAGKTLTFSNGDTTTIQDDWGAIPDSAVPLTAMHKAASWASDTIRDTGDEPTFISAGLNLPHTPFYYPEEVLSRFKPDEIALAPYLEGDRNDVPNYWDTRTNSLRPFLEEATYDGGEGVKGDVLRDYTVSYLASIAFLDDMVGVILDAVEARDDSEQWTIVFLSDHGYHLGEKGHIGKSTLWEESTRVPFMISGPGIATGESDAAVSLIDLYPTLIDHAGLAPDIAIQGRSLSPLLSDPDAPDDGLAISNRGSIISLRTERYRYTRYRNGYEEVYDHAVDPNEWTNLNNDPAYELVRKELRRKFHVWSIESGNQLFSLSHLSNVESEGNRALDWFDGKSGALGDDSQWTRQGAAADFTLVNDALVAPEERVTATVDGVVLAGREDFQTAITVKLENAEAAAGLVLGHGQEGGPMDLLLSGDGKLRLSDEWEWTLPASSLHEWHTLVVNYDASNAELELVVLDDLKVRVLEEIVRIAEPFAAGAGFGIVGQGYAEIDDYSLLTFPAPRMLPGDFNDDGVVDAADYSVWRDSLGKPAGTLANDTADLAVGQLQYEVWRSNFGATSNQLMGEVAVPEPSLLPILLLVAAARHTRVRQATGRLSG